MRHERDEIVGRDAELAAVARFLDAEPPCALVLEGEAGIGKTTIWRAAVDEARGRGVRILACAPAESEAALPFAGLGDLLGGVSSDLLSALPAPQRAALRAALHEAEASEPFDRLAVARAAAASLQALAGDGPVLVAVDDVQWLDAPTARALEFAIRRVGDAPVRLLVARRGDHGASLPLGLDRAPLAGGATLHRIPPLVVNEVDRLLRGRLGLRLPRPALVRLAQITAGNPYYALEVARGFADGRGMTVPPSLADALAARVEGVPAAAREALLLAAASLHPTADLVERAAGGGDGLAAALELGLVELDGDRLRFGHPLLASVAYERALPGTRREAHRRLADAVADREERALHLARGLEHADEATAAELEDAARVAAARGSTGTAAELAEAAARLTPADGEEARRRRLTAAAEQHVASGDPARGREILTVLVERLEPGTARAALLWRLADTIGDSTDEPIRICEQALEEAGGDPALCAEIQTALGVFTWIAGDLTRATEHCLAAARFAEEAGDEARLAIALGEACHAQAILGVRWDRAAMERALELERGGVDVPPSLRPTFQLAVISLVTDDLETARPLLAAEERRCRQIGDEPGLFQTLFRMAELELRDGRWAEALAAAREAVALTGQAGIEQEHATTRMVLALVLAHLGELDEARDLAELAYRDAGDGGDRAVALRCAGVLGFVELSAGRPEDALERLTPARAELERMGTGELSVSGVVQNEIEALVALGRLDDAEEVVAFVEGKGRPTGRAWHRAVAARGRALVASARGDAAAARTALEEALAAHESLPQPFERARTLLAAGAIERRAKRWAAARERYTAALELLDGLGAARWAEVAAGELARLPGRRPRGAELTETERRIAELVAEGLANKDVAARLFVSVRTVEANLSRVYAKLGIRSRTELARRLSA